MRPAHPIVLITGASSGFGLAMARLLAAQGCHLALGARRVERVQALADELVQAHGIKAFAGAVDTRDSASVNTFVAAAASALGGLHVLVANAGLASGTYKMWETPDEDLEGVLRQLVDLFSAGPVADLSRHDGGNARQSGGHLDVEGSVGSCHLLDLPAALQDGRTLQRRVPVGDDASNAERLR